MARAETASGRVARECRFLEARKTESVGSEEIAIRSRIRSETSKALVRCGEVQDEAARLHHMTALTATRDRSSLSQSLVVLCRDSVAPASVCKYS